LDSVTILGVIAVTSMMICYALESRSSWYIIGFAVSCVAASAYGFPQGAWPFGVVELVWSGVALHRWMRARHA
jgi:hypothetical protein